MFFQRLWVNFFAKVIHSLKDTFSIIREQLQIYTSKFLPQSVPPTMISIWDFFFQMMISLPSYDDFLMISRLLKDSFNFGEATSSHFRVTTSIKQLLFQGSYFFRTDFLFGDAHFSEQSFFISVIFQNSLFFRVKLLPSSQSWE